MMQEPSMNGGREQGVLAPFPVWPEESWRRLDARAFFLPVEDVRRSNGELVLQQDGAVEASTQIMHVVEEQMGVEELRLRFAGLSGGIGTVLSSLVATETDAAKTFLIEICGSLVRVIRPIAARSRLKVSLIDRPLRTALRESKIEGALLSRLAAVVGPRPCFEMAAMEGEEPVICVVSHAESTGGLSQDYTAWGLEILPGGTASLVTYEALAPFALRHHEITVRRDALLRQLWVVGNTGETEGLQLTERSVILEENAELRDVHLCASGTGAMVEVKGLGSQPTKGLRMISAIEHAGVGSRSTTGACVVCAGTTRVDYEPIQHHSVPGGKSALRAKVLASGESRASFQGLVDVEKSASRTQASQDNKNLVINGKARIDASPRLRILPDDVACKHGSATGEVDSRQLYYLQTRGYSAEAARELLVNAFARDALFPFGEESLLAEVGSVWLEKTIGRVVAR